MAIVLENLSFAYAQDEIISKASLIFLEGKIHLVIGLNGSGKTTLALLLAGVLTPTAGSIWVDGQDPSSRIFDRSKLQLAFQFPEAQIFESTVEAEISFALANFGLSGSDLKERLMWACTSVGLPRELLTRDPAKLSFGERRRVALASVIAIRPKYLILDEPFAGLDWKGRSYLVKLVADLASSGMTILILTHEVDVVGEIGDTITLLEGAKLSECLSPRDFFALHSEDSWYIPDHIRVQRYLASIGFLAEATFVRIDEVSEAIAETITNGGRTQ